MRFFINFCEGLVSSSNKKKYNLDVYFYNKDGDVKTINVKGNLNKNKPSSYVLNFDKNNLKNDKVRHELKEKEFDDEINKIKELFEDLF